MMLDDIRENASDMVNDEFKKQAKRLRQQIVKEFNDQIAEAIPHIKKGNGRFWTAQLNSHAYFYVSLVFPKYLEGDSRFEIAYHVGRINRYAIMENMYGYKQKYIKFPYRIHHKLFEFPNTPWWKPRVGFLYWKLLMQKRKVYYYNEQQVRYSMDILLPFAMDKLKSEYLVQNTKYEGTDRVPKDVVIGD